MLLDGATGTELSARGMPAGVCPELWVRAHPDILRAMQRDYVEAGSDIVYTCTFGGNPLKLAEFDADDETERINRDLAGLSRAAAPEALIFGDLAPTGVFAEPFGDTPFDEIVAGYRRQIRGLLEGGVDGFAIETMMDIQEARAASIAIRELSDLPVIVTFTYGDDGRMLTGTDAVTALITLQALGADAVGCNCSTGPDGMIEILRTMKPHATVPLVAKPNAGQPRLVEGRTVFDMDAESFAAFVPQFVDTGVNIVGGCCGTTAAHIRLASERARACTPRPPVREAVSAVSSSTRTVFLGGDEPLAVIGERINPTGKQALKDELKEGRLDMVRQYAFDQHRGGAALLDVNMGMAGIDERDMMRKAVKLLSQIVPVPLCIDTTDPAVMEAALRVYPGRALVNSVSAERERIEKMLPVAAKYGAMLILLPLTDEGIPETLAGRKEIVRRLVDAAAACGYRLPDLVVDGLVMTVSSDENAVALTLGLIEWCARELGVNTVGGLSNVSFGLPQRQTVNVTLMAMAVARGLTCALANPCEASTLATKLAADALAGRDPKLKRYIGHFGDSAARAEPTERTPDERVYDCVLYGEEENIATRIDEAIAAGFEPKALVDDSLIPAITRVGELYDRKEYFLPQLMMSADTMRRGFEHLEPLLVRDDGSSAGREKTKIILATVEGDIHDIGKNIVALMLRNYGFEVVDLGKDVDAETILERAAREDVSVIGLSALMTTTMSEMSSVIKRAQERELKSLKFLVGGAVVDQTYADEIGADGYAPDAVQAVRLAQRLTGKD